MAKLPISDVTLIASVLGVFFLIVAFYKSIFHKRGPKTRHTAPSAKPPDTQKNHPVKLSDPFQQVSIGSIPPQHPQNAGSPFYPAYPSNGNEGATVSAFRQFTPNKNLNMAASQESDSVYKWE